MSTHNICFSGEIRKILCGYPLLSVAMENVPSALSVQHMLWVLIKVPWQGAYNEYPQHSGMCLWRN